MIKKKTKHLMWALWNFSRIMGVTHSRRSAMQYANDLHSEPGAADAMFKTGAFRISKVVVREI